MEDFLRRAGSLSSGQLAGLADFVEDLASRRELSEDARMTGEEVESAGHSLPMQHLDIPTTPERWCEPVAQPAPDDVVLEEHYFVAWAWHLRALPRLATTPWAGSVQAAAADGALWSLCVR